jgi:hypothetical protein
VAHLGGVAGRDATVDRGKQACALCDYKG